MTKHEASVFYLLHSNSFRGNWRFEPNRHPITGGKHKTRYFAASMIKMHEAIDYSPTYHCNNVIMSAMVSQISDVSIVYSTVWFRTQIKENKLRAIGLCEGNPPVTSGSPHKGPVTQKNFDLMTSLCVKKTVLWRNPIMTRKRVDQWIPLTKGQLS